MSLTHRGLLKVLLLDKYITQIGPAPLPRLCCFGTGRRCKDAGNAAVETCIASAPSENREVPASFVKYPQHSAATASAAPPEVGRSCSATSSQRSFFARHSAETWGKGALRSALCRAASALALGCVSEPAGCAFQHEKPVFPEKRTSYASRKQKKTTQVF